MHEIILIDDNEYGIKQIENSIPESEKSNVIIKHYFSISDYKEKQKSKPLIILLDYFFSNERSYGELYVTEIKMDILIGFSSMKIFSDRIIAAFKEKNESSDVKLYSIEKNKSSNQNNELKMAFEEIFSS